MSKGSSDNSIKNALLIINGKKAGNNYSEDQINTTAVKNMNVLKGIDAISKYGEEGKNGVIEITSDTPDYVLTKIAIGFPMPKK